MQINKVHILNCLNCDIWTNIGVPNRKSKYMIAIQFRFFLIVQTIALLTNTVVTGDVKKHVPEKSLNTFSRSSMEYYYVL